MWLWNAPAENILMIYGREACHGSGWKNEREWKYRPCLRREEWWKSRNMGMREDEVVKCLLKICWWFMKEKCVRVVGESTSVSECIKYVWRRRERVGSRGIRVSESIIKLWNVSVESTLGNYVWRVCQGSAWKHGRKWKYETCLDAEGVKEAEKYGSEGANGCEMALLKICWWFMEEKCVKEVVESMDVSEKYKITL